ncbi:MAG: class I SAM-dependent methyltransferase [Chloroflexi bacterium]|nr:class I SAM-dependent methyltransferase [Chloroflexota bacterium]
MRRVQLFEFEDLGWFPESIRDGGTDLLRFGWEIGKVYKPIVPRLKDALLRTGSREILDLGSGGAGPVVAIHKELVKSGLGVRITLTDKFPNLSAFKHAKERTNGGIDFIQEPVDATAVPAHLGGFRTMFLSLHHFPPDLVRRILQDAVQQRRPIGIFDFSVRTPPPLSMLLINNPLGVLLVTPFVRPFRWSRLLWTYLIPLVPFFFLWDAFASGLRLYSVRELKEIVDGLPSNDYVWEIGQERFPGSITYLIGCPK